MANGIQQTGTQWGAGLGSRQFERMLEVKSAELGSEALHREADAVEAEAEARDPVAVMRRRGFHVLGGVVSSRQLDGPSDVQRGSMLHQRAPGDDGYEGEQTQSKVKRLRIRRRQKSNQGLLSSFD